MRVPAKLALVPFMIGLVMISTHAGSVLAATFAVNSTADAVDATPGDGFCDDGTGNCTLRAAIMEANALAGDDTINLPAGTYTLTVGSELTISSSMLELHSSSGMAATFSRRWSSTKAVG